MDPEMAAGEKSIALLQTMKKDIFEVLGKYSISDGPAGIIWNYHNMCSPTYDEYNIESRGYQLRFCPGLYSNSKDYFKVSYITEDDVWLQSVYYQINPSRFIPGNSESSSASVPGFSFTNAKKFKPSKNNLQKFIAWRWSHGDNEFVVTMLKDQGMIVMCNDKLLPVVDYWENRADAGDEKDNA